MRYGPIDCGIIKNTPHTFATTGNNFGHNHPVSRLIIILDGTQRISWGNEERTLSPGAGAFLPGDIAVRRDTWSVTTHAYLDIARDDPGLGPILRHLPPGCWPSEAPTLVALGAFVRSLVRREEKCVTWASRAAMRHALEAMVSTALSSLPVADTPDRPALTPRELALQYIRTHYSNPALTPCGVARQLGLSVRTLQRSFEGEQSLVQWIAHFRLERALMLLQDPQLTNLTLPEIASRAGFGSTAVLRRAVAAATGVLPSEYREQHLSALPDDD
jgi:AraC-like DNA-binding protein